MTFNADAEKRIITISESAPIQPQGLLKLLTEFYSNGVPENLRDWSESVATCQVGSFMNDITLNNKLGHVKPILFTMIIGESALTFKSVPLSKAEKIQQLVTKKKNEQLLAENTFSEENNISSVEDYQEYLHEHSSEKSKNKNTDDYKQKTSNLKLIGKMLVDYVSLSRFSSESLVSHLTRFPVGMGFSDEWSKMIKGASKKDYMSDYTEDMSLLYDGKMNKSGTISRGIEYPDNTHICLAAATTPSVYKHMEDEFWEQGLGTRINFVRRKGDTPLPPPTGDFFMGLDASSVDEKQREMLSNLLLKITTFPRGEIIIDVDACIILEYFHVRQYNIAVKTEGLEKSVIARMSLSVIKHAMVHCISRYAVMEETPEHSFFISINMDDVEWAINKVYRHYQYYKTILNESVGRREGSVRDIKNDKEKVYAAIQKFKGSVAIAQIYQFCNWSKIQTAPIIDTMMSSEEILYNEKDKKYYYGKNSGRIF